MEYKISVIIRTYNEEKHLKEVLEILSKQLYDNFEIVIVDSQSNDNTLIIAKEYKCKILSINKSDFNYSYASNIGAQNASGDILCFLSGHSVPIYDNFLEQINEYFQNPMIGGCYGETIALEDGSITEKLFNYYGYVRGKKTGVYTENAIHPGILSCNNAAIRKELWEKHFFSEKLGLGGEDVGMAYHIIRDGYLILRSPITLVRHSHGSGFFKFLKEFKNWRKLYQDVLKYIDVYEEGNK